MSFGGETKSRRLLLSGVYARETKRSHTGSKFLTMSVRQAGVAAHRAVTLEEDRPLDWHASGDHNVITLTFPLCGATGYILPSRTMSHGVHFVYHSVEVYWTFRNYLRVLIRIRNFYNGINYTSWRLPRYVLDRLFGNLTDKARWNVDDRNNVDMLPIITRETKSKFQLTIGVFSIAFVMSVIENFTEFLNTLTKKYELRNKCWMLTVVMIQSVPHCLCWLFYFQNTITFLFEKLSCAVEILIWSDAVNFLTKSLGMLYSVFTAQ